MGCFSQKGLCYSFGIFFGLLSNKIIRNPMKKIFGRSPLHPQLTIFWPEMGKFGEIDSADMRAEKFPLVPMGGWAEGPACADTGARTPIGASGILSFIFLTLKIFWSYLAESGKQVQVSYQNEHFCIYLVASLFRWITEGSGSRVAIKFEPYDNWF